MGRLKRILAVSKCLEIARLAELLHVDEAYVWENIIDWAERFQFTIDKDTVTFCPGTMDGFIEGLDKEFRAWQEREATKDGKKERALES